jgi:hypothetical protein
MKKIIKLRNDVITILVVLIVLAVGTALLYAVSTVFNPLLILLIVSVLILCFSIKNYILRIYSLKRYGYFGGNLIFRHGLCKYEEYNMGKLVDLKVGITNTEPGHWELFVPTEQEWRNNTPSWATNRRIEIIERIKPYFKKNDIHLPDDYKK